MLFRSCSDRDYLGHPRGSRDGASRAATSDVPCGPKIKPVPGTTQAGAITTVLSTSPRYGELLWGEFWGLGLKGYSEIGPDSVLRSQLWRYLGNLVQRSGTQLMSSKKARQLP